MTESSRHFRQGNQKTEGRRSQLQQDGKPSSSTRRWASTGQWGQVREASLTSDFRDTQETGRQDDQGFGVLVQVLSLMGSRTSSTPLPQAPHPKMRVPSSMTSEFLRPVKHTITWGQRRGVEFSHLISPETPIIRFEEYLYFQLPIKKMVY